MINILLVIFATMYTLQKDCNVRYEPSIKSDRFEFITKGEKVEVVERNEWYKVKLYPDVVGYVWEGCFHGSHHNTQHDDGGINSYMQ